MKLDRRGSKNPMNTSLVINDQVYSLRVLTPTCIMVLDHIKGSIGDQKFDITKAGSDIQMNIHVEGYYEPYIHLITTHKGNKCASGSIGIAWVLRLPEMEMTLFMYTTLILFTLVFFFIRCGHFSKGDFSLPEEFEGDAKHPVPRCGCATEQVFASLVATGAHLGLLVCIYIVALLCNEHIPLHEYWILYSCTCLVLGCLYSYVCQSLWVSRREDPFAPGVFVIPAVLILFLFGSSWRSQERQEIEAPFGVLLCLGIGVPLTYIGAKLGHVIVSRTVGCAPTVYPVHRTPSNWNWVVVWVCNVIHLGLLYVTSVELQLRYISKEWWSMGRTSGLLLLTMSMFTIIFSVEHTYFALGAAGPPIYWQSFGMPIYAYMGYAYWGENLETLPIVPWVIIICGIFQGSISWFVSNCFIRYIVQSIKIE